MPWRATAALRAAIPPKRPPGPGRGGRMASRFRGCEHWERLPCRANAGPAAAAPAPPPAATTKRLGDAAATARIFYAARDSIGADGAPAIMRGAQPAVVTPKSFCNLTKRPPHI